MIAVSLAAALALAHVSAGAIEEAGLPDSGTIEVTAAETRGGYEALMAGDNARAIAEIEANRSLAQDDPARLINLGIAHARLGDTARAQDLFSAAVATSDQMELETATGEWIYSRAIARQALNRLEQGDLEMVRIAIR
ncbi:MAG: hypothetical protein ACO25F_05890 [Erythrobacter sp.]